VNDLDLLVTQGGTTWLGNRFSGGFSVTGGTADSKNNLEGANLAPGVLGCAATFQVKVRAQTLAGDGVPGNADSTDQDFALLVRNAGGSPGPPIMAAPASATAAGCDLDGFLDRRETVDLTVDLTNAGCSLAPGVGATLTVLSGPPGAVVTVSPGGAQSVGDVVAGATAQATWQVALADDAASFCGETVTFQVAINDAASRTWTETVLIVLDADGFTPVTDLDPATADQSVQRDADWGLQACRTTSGPTSWHMGQADCTGIPRDASAQSLTFEYTLAPTDALSSLTFQHAFDGYNNGTLRDSVTAEIDHDADGLYDALQTWQDGLDAPASMTPAGPFDLTGFNAGRASAVRVRLRFQSAANWVGGPNNAAGWDVDDIALAYESIACDPYTCVACPGPPPSAVPDGSGGSTALTVDQAGGGLAISWGSIAGATRYNLYAGTIGAWYSHAVLADPGLAGGDSCHEPTTSVTTVAMPAGNVYFLVAADDGCFESVYGFDSNGLPVPYAAAPCTPH